MLIQYEINGSYFKDTNLTIGELYTLDNQGNIDASEKVRYDTLEEAKRVSSANIDKFEAVTIYKWDAENEVILDVIEIK